jgi:protein SCO1
MKTLRLPSIGRGACPQAPSLTPRAVGGNSPYRLALVLLLAGFSCRSLLAGDLPQPSRASTLPQPATSQEEGCACCRKEAEAKPAKCCAEEPSVPVEKKACCAGEEKRPAAEAPASFSKESLYQLDARFTADSGRPFALGSLRGKPVVVDLFFASCGYACPLTVTDMLAIQGRLPAEMRRETVFVLVSFDIARDTPEALAQYRRQRGLDGQWVLLHGGDEDVRELAALLGVKYKQEADGAFSHSNLVTVLNREGEIVHQRIGLKGGLDEAAAAIVRVASGETKP